MVARWVDDRINPLIDSEMQVTYIDIGRRGDRGASGSPSGAYLDITDFEYLGVDYAAVPNAHEDQDAVVDALFAALAAGPIKRGYVPGFFALGWLERSVNGRTLPEDCELFGDGPERSGFFGLEDTFLANVDELQTGTLMHYSSRSTMRGLRFDGRGDEIRAIPGTTNRLTTLVDSKVIAGDITDPAIADLGAEDWWNIDCEFTGQFSNEVAATILTSNDTGDYQFTLDSGHIVETDDTILVRSHTGATFERYDGSGTLVDTWSGTGLYIVTAVDGDDIQVVHEATGDAIVVTVAGTGGFVDNTTTRGLEGFGFACSHGRNGHIIRPYAHHNEGSGIAFNWRDRENTDWGHSFQVIDPECHYNGWQGVALWGVRDVVVQNHECHSNDRVGMNSEYSNNVVVINGRSNNNGIHGFRDLGDGAGATYTNCDGKHNGAVDFETTFGAIQYPNDPTFTTAARTDGTTYGVVSAKWTRLGLNRVGTPRLVTYNDCTSTPAEGKYDIRTRVHSTANAPWGSTPRIIINGPQLFQFQPLTNTGEEPDANGTVNLQARPEYPMLTTVQRVPLPPLSTWDAVSGATQAAPSGAWTTGLTSTANATDTVITWTAHGFVTGSRVVLQGFGGVGQAQINRAESWVVKRIDANSFSIPVASTSNGTGGRGIDYRAELAGVTSDLARTIEFATGGSGYRYTMPYDRLRGRWIPRYKVIPSDDWWTMGVTSTPGDPTEWDWGSAHGRISGDRVKFEDMAGSDDVNVNDAEGFIIIVTGTDTFTIDLETTGAASGGRAAFVTNIAIVDIGIRNAGGGGDPANTRWFSTIYQSYTVGDLYTWHEPQILATERADVPSTWRLSIQMNTAHSISGHKLVVDYVGPWHSLVQRKAVATEQPSILTGTLAYAGETLGNGVNGAAQIVSGLTDVEPGDIVTVGLTSLAGLGPTHVIARVHASGALRFQVRNVAGVGSVVYPAGTFFWKVERAPR